ncbi:MAG: hypothetical protein NTV07_00370 [Candidatus Omnitrophica bacterium]|nr:hypothetical protein [Candidatus Omnitrophota bacterium]
MEKNNIGVIIDDFTPVAYKKGVNKLRELLREGESLKARCRKVAEDALSLDMGVEKYRQIYERILA